MQSLGGGPAIPSAAEVSTSGANVGLGQQLFTADCAQCHNFVGAGGSLTYGKFAPPLTQSTPTQIYEAMLTGPEAMPVFNNTTILPSEKRDIIAYVTADPGRAQPGRRQPGPRRAGHRGPRGVPRAAPVHGAGGPLDHGEAREAPGGPARGERELMSETTGRDLPGEHGQPEQAAGDAAQQADGPVAPHRVIGTPSPAEARVMLPERDQPPARELPADPDDPVVAKKAERVVAVCFVLSMLAGLGFIAAYVIFQVHTISGTRNSNLALGTTMGLAFLFLGIGATIWVRRIMPHGGDDRGAQAAGLADGGPGGIRRDLPGGR